MQSNFVRMRITCGSVHYEFTYLSGRCVRLWMSHYYSALKIPHDMKLYV